MGTTNRDRITSIFCHAAQGGQGKQSRVAIDIMNMSMRVAVTGIITLTFTNRNMAYILRYLCIVTAIYRRDYT